ncbi:MAG: M13 family metallopeptidase [Pseudonocardia sp.]
MRRAAAITAAITILAVTTSCTSPPSPPPVSGVDLAGFDRAVRPQDDLFGFVNGGWLASTEIPPDRSRYGAFDVLREKADADVRVIAEELDAAADQPGAESQKIADLYASFLDAPRLDALGATPLAAELARIDALTSPADLPAYFGHRARSGLPSPVGFFVQQDVRNATAYVVGVDQAGLTLPDRDYYLVDNDSFTMIKGRFSDYVTQMLTLAGVPDAKAAAPAVVALETRLAQAQWTNVQLRDPIATYNKLPVAQAPGLDWPRYLDSAGAPVTELVVGEPSFFTALGAATTEVPLADWKSYLRFTVVNTYAPVLGTAFADAAFEFHGKLLLGQEQQRPRWKRAVARVNEVLGEAVGKRYVERHFPPEAKQRIDTLVANLIAEFRTSIDELDWMSEPTKAEARDKLSTFAVKIGYPATWKDYSALEIRRDDLIGNLQRSAEVEFARELAKLGKPVDRNEWFATPQTVNAYYNPPMNEITFPAGILQPPFFDARADDAVNYGGIGAVIGHEISHGFDDQGRKFDGTGNLRDWWTPEDVTRFSERTARLVAQYGAYSPVEGGTVNGELTLGENIADLSGMAVAFKAYRRSLAGAPAPMLDGFTGDQRFFIGNAQVWRGKIRDDALRQQLLTDPHSPAQYRSNGVVTNLPGFYEAFDVAPTDKLFRPAEERVALW